MNKITITVFFALALLFAVSSGHYYPSGRTPWFCYLPRDNGKCYASMTRWYYDRYSGRCWKFMYGGCKGNKNNFPTYWDCMRICRPF